MRAPLCHARALPSSAAPQTPFIAMPFPRLLPVLLLAAALPAQRQTPADTHGRSRHGEEFNEGPRQAAYLMAGMSEQVHFPVAGLGAEAQRFFDQGITQHHGFWYFEAERSFRQVAKLHPESAMAYWGMAMANVENPKRAAGFAAQAVQRATGCAAREQRWVDLMAEYYQIDAAARADLQSGDVERATKARAQVVAKNATRDEKDLGRRLIRGYEAIVAAEPGDIEAKAFLVVQNWRNIEHGLPISCHAGLDALLDQVFAKAPLHPAHHYRVHLWDDEKAERALRSAALLGHSAPGIAHQWHMGGHIFAGLDRHSDAVWQQEASSRVDHAYMARDRVMPFAIHNYGHNQEWTVRSLMHLGRVRDALELARNMVALPRHPRDNMVGKDRNIADYGRQRLLDVLETYALWDEAVACCEGGGIEPVEPIRAEVARLSVLGRAHFRRGQPDAGKAVMAEAGRLLVRARAERAAALDQAETAALAAKKDDGAVLKDMDDAMRRSTDPVRAVLDLQRELRAEELLANGDAEAALSELEGLAGFPKTLLAEVHVRAGNPAKAVEILDKEIEERPNRVPTLTHRLLALHAAGRIDDARQHFAALRKVAGHADLDAPLLRRLAPLAAEFGAPADWREPEPVPADAGERPPLAGLGPFHWSPPPAPDLELPVAGAGSWSLRARAPRATLVVFYLGFGCLHCVEQLKALVPRAKDFAAAGIDVVAVGTDPAAVVLDSLATFTPEERFPFPLLVDPELRAFRAWHCHDDFESMPLHGTFLVDGQGKIRWQEIRFEPFVEFDFLLRESRRLLGLPGAGGGSK
ncbi:MAG: redoxin domain-containing protein [Planctomycetes bacterium]|nr:redoxin domain-containing protein [Planctomycetota bacterium]